MVLISVYNFPEVFLKLIVFEANFREVYKTNLTKF